MFTEVVDYTKLAGLIYLCVIDFGELLFLEAA